MKQDAMDDKITERCKTCEKQCMQEDFDRSRSYRATIKQKPTLMDQIAIEQTESFSMDRESVEKQSSLIKNSFSKRGKTHKNECKQVSYSTNDLNNILNFQKHHLTRKMQSIHDPKRTHTLNKSNQFYILKTSQDSLVSTHLHMYPL